MFTALFDAMYALLLLAIEMPTGVLYDIAAAKYWCLLLTSSIACVSMFVCKIGKFYHPCWEIIYTVISYSSKCDGINFKVDGHIQLIHSNFSVEIPPN